MTKQNCDCNDVFVVEGVFGEVFSDNDADKAESKPASTCGEGDHQSHREGSSSPATIKSYKMCNASRMEVVVISYGATIVSVKCPDKYGDQADVVLGFDDLQSYLDPTLNQFFGCALGRCTNRIKKGTFKLKDHEYSLTRNESNKHHLHGGTNGFGRRVWESHVEEDRVVVMSYMSPDGEEGYPGAVLVTIKFTLTSDNKLKIGMRASTSKPTVVNLSHGSLFNLAGHDAGEEELRAHVISLNCDRWTYAEYENPVPSGAIRGVGGTIMDLRIPRPLGCLIEKVPPGEGFDHNFCVVRRSQPELMFVARVFHPNSGRYLEVYSDQPGVHLYTCGRLPSPKPLPPSPSSTTRDGDSQCTTCECTPCDCESSQSSADGSSTSGSRHVTTPLEYVPGKCGAKYRKFAAVGLQPQNYPDAVNVPHFPCPILRPGQVYYHDLVYKFGIQLSSYMH